MKIIISEEQLYEIKKILTETPDKVISDDYVIAKWLDKDALAFGFYQNKAYVGFNRGLFMNSNNISIELKNDISKMDEVQVLKSTIHDNIWLAYSRLDKPQPPHDRYDFSFPGRLWYEKKIINFWLYPKQEELPRLLKQLSNEFFDIYGYRVNFNDFKIEIKEKEYKPDLDFNDDDYVGDTDWLFSKKHGNLIPISQYLGSDDYSGENIHLLPSDQKRNTPQMQAVRDSDAERLSNKFNGNISQAEWNNAKKKYQGESKESEKNLIEDINIPVNTGDTVMMGKFKNKKTVVKDIDKDNHGMPTINGKQATTFRMSNKIEEMIASDVNLSSFEVKKELNNKFWDNKKINNKVRRRLLKIADDFLEFINVDSKYCKDILLLGSLSNYNWSKYSDVDLHLLIDFTKINKDIDLVRDYFDTKRKLWNNEHDSLKIYGFPVEIYIQDVNDESVSNGIFSLEKNKWNKIPNDKQAELLNKSKIRQKSADIMTKIDNLEIEYNKKANTSELEGISKKVKIIFDNIKKLRKSGLESNDGEMSTGNIVFKVLRRSGYIEKLVDLKRNTYDKINTIK